MNEYALITGASRGIGKSMALLLAKAGYHLLLVSRSENELQELAELIRKQYQVKVSYLAADLSASNTTQQVAEWCNKETSTLSVLINNAGYGIWGNFDQLQLSDQLDMLQLNINAVLALTHHLLPFLKQQKHAYILNISSTAAYQAVPTLALYSASKSFILQYSRALRYELKGSSVSVSCLCPGPTATGFASRAGMQALDHLAEKFNMTPEIVAKAGLKGMFNKKAEIIPGLMNLLSVYGVRFIPKSLTERIAANLYKF
ncbi:SDR family oxidoreductase [Pedobacter sp. L105]|uniref:SDR family NAD(P)-dependent oxidoreductase n=1 Tax=Pedobacter sp. L105 TaxID=1641871 RepID=UPI00131CA6B4|nr:SDR family oxidoreductase [Pedobacter sp. L105]